ncbi:hypothetical protein [Bradyrhizobium yuanmingense]|uniref:hypothetical protein n=1 Tax=Bradyrhizobium yuanmingense TaxID=108015 RepID=UPI003511F91D
MPVLRLAARDKIDLHLSEQAQHRAHRELAHAAKRVAAQQLLAGEPNTDLDFEASLRGITPLELAQVIVSKPNTLMQRENQRQAAFAEIAAATLPAQLDAIVEATLQRNDPT